MPAAPATACCSAMPTSKHAAREVVLERQQTGRPRHRGRDGHDPRILLGDLDDTLGERLGVAGGHRLGWALDRVEHGRVVEVLLVVVLGGRVPAALLGEHVDHDRALGGELLRVAEGGFHLGHVVTVERADVAHAERLEERRWLEELADTGLEPLHRLFGLRADRRQVGEELLEPPLAPHVDRVEPDVGEGVGELVGELVGQAGVVDPLVGALAVGRQVRHGRRVAATVVVQHDDHAALAVTEVVERLVRHPAGHRPVTDHGDDVAVVVDTGVAGDRHPVGVAEHGRGVAVLDVIVGAFLAAGISGQPARLTQTVRTGRAGR